MNVFLWTGDCYQGQDSGGAQTAAEQIQKPLRWTNILRTWRILIDIQKLGYCSGNISPASYNLVSCVKSQAVSYWFMLVLYWTSKCSSTSCGCCHCQSSRQPDGWPFLVSLSNWEINCVKSFIFMVFPLSIYLIVANFLWLLYSLCVPPC